MILRQIVTVLTSALLIRINQGNTRCLLQCMLYTDVNIFLSGEKLNSLHALNNW